MKHSRILPQTAQLLINKGKEHNVLEPTEDGSGVWVHGYACQKNCDYGCGAALIHLDKAGRPTGDVDTLIEFNPTTEGDLSKVQAN